MRLLYLVSDFAFYLFTIVAFAAISLYSSFYIALYLLPPVSGFYAYLVLGMMALLAALTAIGAAHVLNWIFDHSFELTPWKAFTPVQIVWLVAIMIADFPVATVLVIGIAFHRKYPDLVPPDKNQITPELIVKVSDVWTAYLHDPANRFFLIGTAIVAAIAVWFIPRLILAPAMKMGMPYND